MFCALLGIIPPSKRIWKHLQNEVTTINDTPLQWSNEHSFAPDDDKEGSPMTLLVTVNGHDSITPHDILSAVETAFSSFSFSIEEEEDYSCEVWASAPAPLPLRPPPPQNNSNNNNEGYNAITNAQYTKNEKVIVNTIQKWGIYLQNSLLHETQLQQLQTLVQYAIQHMHEQLAIHRPTLKVGVDEFSFREIASRSYERFDLRLNNHYAAVATNDENDDVDDDDAATTTIISPWQKETTAFVEQHILSDDQVSSTIQNVLNATMEEINYDISVVYSRPGATYQGWHADGNYIKGSNDAGWWNIDNNNNNNNDNDDNVEEEENYQQKTPSFSTPYALCLFIPLINLQKEVGYTQFWPRSHYNRDLSGFGKVAEITNATFDAICNAGDSIWYDYRLMHRGMPNCSTNGVVRPVLQIIFKKKWYVERANYGVESVFGGVRGGHGCSCDDDGLLSVADEKKVS